MSASISASGISASKLDVAQLLQSVRHARIMRWPHKWTSDDSCVRCRAATKTRPAVWNSETTVVDYEPM
jgi:hypothetical protein